MSSMIIYIKESWPPVVAQEGDFRVEIGEGGGGGTSSL